MTFDFVVTDVEEEGETFALQLWPANKVDRVCHTVAMVACPSGSFMIGAIHLYMYSMPEKHAKRI